MPDNWGFVAAAYALAALMLGAYWLRLARREREIARGKRGAPPKSETIDRASRTEPRPPETGHPRFEPTSRNPLQ